ncbi:MAG: hypothetical protein IPM48_07595 [Saprospiraceae bacterium]|nr:hypothetical protein [Saprospiraceae bacterium]
MKTYQFCFLLLTAFLISSCSTNKKTLDDQNSKDPLQPMISFKKTPCFGKCKVYKISVYQDGLTILEGIEHIEKTGVHFGQLDKTELEKLKKDLRSLPWNTYKPSYFKNIPDLPSTELRYFHSRDSIQTIKSNTSLPNDLESIQTRLAELVESLKWTEVMKKHELNSPNHIYNEIQVDMDSSLTQEYLVKRFDKYGLKVKDRISIYMNFWLFTYDDQKITPYEMLILLRKTPGVRLVMFNRKLDLREH